MAPIWTPATRARIGIENRQYRLELAVTDTAFTGVLANSGTATSVGGEGAWRDKVFVGRLWRSVKYKEVYSL